MTCSRCATINPDGAQICAACGAPLVMGAAPPPPGAYMPQPGQMPPGAMPYGYGMAPPQRSGIPKVMGILMIIFASIGLLVSLGGLSGPKDQEMFGGSDAYSHYVSMEKAFALIGLALGVLHLLAGIFLVRYKRSGPMLSYLYGIAAIILTILHLVLVYAWIVPALKEINPDASTIVGGVFAVVAVFACTWPILVLILVSRPNARAACVN